MEVSIVIPAFNEEKGIGGVLDSLKEIVKNSQIKHEIIVVDDGSVDRTAQIARKKGAIVLIHPTNSGYGAALMSGMLKAKYQNIAILDADGTYPALKLPELLKYADKGFDLVIGARSGKYFRYAWFKQPVRFFFKIISEFVTGTKIPDPNSGFRIYKKKAILPLLNSRTCRGFSFSTSTTLIFLLEGKFVKFVPIDYYARKGKSKIKFARDAFRASQILMETIVFYNPFKLFLLISLFFSALTFASLMIYVFNRSILLLVLFSLFFLSGVFSFCLGLAMSAFKKNYRYVEDESD